MSPGRTRSPASSAICRTLYFDEPTAGCRMRWGATEFELSRDEPGWLTLEFLAWWVRDLSGPTVRSN